ncbi:MAG: FAD/NAD(P)-binding protein [Planctomycetota bacterium]|nr:FAD/NAD(P)-binding protein [Planctomycetota bacterium]
MSLENSYVPMPAELLDVIDETPTIKTLVLAPQEPLAFSAGQFVQLTLPGVGEAPFTPSSSPLEKDRLAITILKTGAITDRLHECKAGQKLALRGPFGKGYPIGKLSGKEVLVVGGGVGLAPLRALILALLADMGSIKRLSIRYGARCMEELLYRGQHEKWAAHEKVDFTCSIDNPQEGWTGRTGVVTTLLKGLDVEKSNAFAFVCGPSIMLKFTTSTLIEEGLAPEQIYLSMNRRMSCGMGLCGRCNIGPYYLCKDGPDMNYAVIKDYPNVF